MDDTTIDWRAIVDDYGFFLFRVEIPAAAAVIVVAAAAGEEEGVELALFDGPPPVGREYAAVWFTTGGAHQYAAALAAASVTSEATSEQLQAWSNDDPPRPVMVTVATDPTEGDAVYLDIGVEPPASALVSRQDAAHAAQAISAAVAYLLAHGIAVTGTDAHGAPVELAVHAQEGEDAVTLFRRPDEPSGMAVLTAEKGLDLYDGLDDVVTSSVVVAVLVSGTDEDGCPLQMTVQSIEDSADGSVGTLILFRFASGDQALVAFDADRTTDLRDVLGVALAAASDWQCPECAEPVQYAPPTANPAWAQARIDTHGRDLPHWSHTDGAPLCPVVGPHGYEPARPVPVDDDTDGM